VKIQEISINFVTNILNTGTFHEYVLKQPIPNVQYDNLPIGIQSIFVLLYITSAEACGIYVRIREQTLIVGP